MKFGEVARFVKSGSSSSRQEIFVEAWDCHTIGMGGNRINRVTETIKTWENEDQRDRIGKMSELGQKKPITYQIHCDFSHAGSCKNAGNLYSTSVVWSKSHSRFTEN